MTEISGKVSGDYPKNDLDRINEMASDLDKMISRCKSKTGLSYEDYQILDYGQQALSHLHKLLEKCGYN